MPLVFWGPTTITCFEWIDMFRKPKKRKNLYAYRVVFNLLIRWSYLYMKLFHTEEPSDAGGDDKSECPAMEGFLKKLNSQGVWKDRYCQLQNVYFMTYKPKDKKGPSNEVRKCRIFFYQPK